MLLPAMLPYSADYYSQVYHKTEDRYDAKTVFTNSKESLRQTEILKKHIYDYLISDSKVEREFASALEASEEVTVYAKLPKGFYITTPVAKYSPDWAIVFDKDKVRQIYFVAETKSEGQELRGSEKLKIECGKAHFKNFEDIVYKKVSSVSDLID